MSLIEVNNLKKEYSTDKEVITRALQGVSFNIEPGEFVAIMGPSGSGKSTLMHILGFLDRPTSGLYKFESKDVSQLRDDQLAELRNKKIGFIFQFFNLLPRTNVFDNVKLTLLYGQGSVDLLRVKKAIETAGIGHRINHHPNQLSGGEQQRVAIARALVNNPEIIFADEPTGNLDSKSTEQIMDLLKKLNQQGKTIVLVTHESYIAKQTKRILYLEDGRLIRDEKL